MNVETAHHVATTSSLGLADFKPATGSGSDGAVTFGDVLSAVNPLQYLPVVGTIYRAITGDEAHPAFRVAVSAVTSLILGGPIGLAATMLGCAGEQMLASRHSAGGGPLVASSSGLSSGTALSAYAQVALSHDTAHGRTGAVASVA